MSSPLEPINNISPINDKHNIQEPKSDTLVIPSNQNFGMENIELEKGPTQNLAEANTDILDNSQPPGNPSLVTWDSPEDPENPYNWPAWRKWSVTLLTSCGGLVTLMSGTMMAPALGQISKDLHITDLTTQMTLSIYVLSFAFGPMVLAPMTEVFGRKPVWLLAGCFYILWNTVSGFAKGKSLMIASRFLAGLGASAEFAVTNPVLSDCWLPEQRGHAFSISTFIPLLGPALGPIIGGLINGSIGWRWIFWVLSIFDVVLMICTFFIFPETHAGTILGRKAKTLRKQTGQEYYTEYEQANQTLSERLANSLTRPCRLLLTQPIIQLMSLFFAYNFGILYIVLSTFASLWTDRYGQSVSDSGLHYIALAIGYTIAAQLGARITDRIWQHLKTRANGETQPEYRVALMFPGAILIPVGLFWYGWTAQAKTTWILPDVGIAIFGCGIILGTQAMQAYVMDSFPTHVASAGAASQLLRSIAGFAFPLFAPRLYQRLGYGLGNSLLALVFIGIGIPAPLILWKYGARLRAMGKTQW